MDKITPRYLHDCETCTFIGTHQGHDLYVCGTFDRRTYIARHSNRMDDYLAAPIDCLHDAPPDHLLSIAKRRHEEGIAITESNASVSAFYEKAGDGCNINTHAPDEE